MRNLLETFEKMSETSMSCRGAHNAIQDASDLCSISLNPPSSFLSWRPPSPMVPFWSPKMSVQNHPKRHAWDAGKPMRKFFKPMRRPRFLKTTYAPPSGLFYSYAPPRPNSSRHTILARDNICFAIHYFSYLFIYLFLVWLKSYIYIYVYIYIYILAHGFIFSCKSFWLCQGLLPPDPRSMKFKIVSF